MLGNVASMHLRSEAQQCICDMPRNHGTEWKGWAEAVGIALAVTATLVSQHFPWNIDGMPTHVDCPHMQLNICHFKGQILI